MTAITRCTTRTIATDNGHIEQIIGGVKTVAF